MTSRRFGCIEPFTTFDSLASRYGRPAASEEFFRALLTYGTFDAYDVFCPDVESHRKFTRRLEEVVPDEAVRRRVETSLRIALHEAVTTRDYTVFHTTDATHAMPALARLRNKFAGTSFPVTSTALPGDRVQRVAHWIEVALGGMQPYDALVAPSKALGTSIKRQLEQATRMLGTDRTAEPRIETLPLGIDPELVQPKSKAEARAFLHMKDHWTVGLSVGRISHRSKLDWSPMLEILARMNAQGGLESTLFIIAGAGDPISVEILQTVVNELGLSSRVLVFANFKPEVRQSLYACADFFVAPVDNAHAQTALTVAEALASGLPVLASDFGPYRELVKPGVNGMLIPTHSLGAPPDFLAASQSLLEPDLEQLYLAQTTVVDVNALDDAFRTMATQPTLRQTLGMQARESVKGHTWPVVIREYEALWTELKAQASRAGKVMAPATQELSGSDLGATYGHYVSDVMGADEELMLNPRVVPNSRLVRYDDVRICIFEPLECLLMETLADGPKSIAALRALGSKTLQVSEAYVDFHMMWLLKHGRLARA